MLQPTDRPPASLAPRLAASMMPGPPPVMTAKPAWVRQRAVSQAALYIGSDSAVRAEPKIAMAAPTSASASKPCTYSPMMRSTRHGSPCVNSAKAGERGTGRGCLGRCSSSSSSVASPARAVRLNEMLGTSGAASSAGRLLLAASDERLERVCLLMLGVFSPLLQCCGKSETKNKRAEDPLVIRGSQIGSPCQRQ